MAARAMVIADAMAKSTIVHRTASRAWPLAAWALLGAGQAASDLPAASTGADLGAIRALPSTAGFGAGGLPDSPWQHCAATAPSGTATQPQTTQTADTVTGNGPIQIEADQFQTTLTDTGITRASGDVVLQHGPHQLLASQVRVSRTPARVDLAGPLRYRNGGIEFHSSGGHLLPDRHQGEFRDVHYFIASRHAGGASLRLEFVNADTVHLDAASYTTCPSNDPIWVLSADDIALNRATGRGTARNTTVRFAGVPIFYLPYLDFPIDGRRQSGFLTPSFGSSKKHGIDLRAPYYWNIAPNYDATITPRVLSKRGLMLHNTLRYRLPGQQGEAHAEVLLNDDLTGETRHFLSLAHRWTPDRRWHGQLRFQAVSDQTYLQDFGDGLTDSNASHLHRFAEAVYDDASSHLELRLDDFRTLDSTVAATEQPYSVLPRAHYTRDVDISGSGLRGRIQGEIAGFRHNTLIGGWRANVSPALSLPLRRPWGELTATLTLDLTHYRLNAPASGADTHPSRALPLVSVDGRLFFERTYQTGQRTTLHTVEPRAYYLYVPHNDQSDLPLFDTNTYTPGFSGLFRDNRFSGGDRIGDTHQLSVAVTSRLIDSAAAREWLRADLASTVFFRDRREQLPSPLAATAGHAELIARLNTTLSDRWSGGAEWVYGPDGHSTVKRNVEINYRAGPHRLLTLRQRFLRQTTGHTDLSGYWRLSPAWAIVGRYDYSGRRNEPLEALLGVEYDTCCWALRLAARDYLTADDNRRDRAILLQLEFKGLTGLGRGARDLLAERIKDYRPTF